MYPLPIKEYPNSFYFITSNSLYGNVAIDEENTFLPFASDYHHLILNGNMGHRDLYHQVCNIKQQNRFQVINEDVIPFITSYSGTVHGFCGVLSILEHYVSNINEYKNYKILLLKHHDKGILDIIDYFCELNLIQKDKIIFLDFDTLYKFKSIFLIPNSLHHYFENVHIRDKISCMLQKYVIEFNNGRDKPASCFNKIAIIKNSKFPTTTQLGITTYEIASMFANNFHYHLLEPTVCGEINLICYLSNCEELIISWGTAFMKNFVYISNKCKKVTILIIGNEFLHEYNHTKRHNQLVTKYKNAEFIYKTTDNTLSEFCDL